MIFAKVLRIFLLLLYIVQFGVSEEEIYIDSYHYYELNEYSDDEIKCLDKEKFFFKNECRFLLNKDSCGPGEWLVLEKSDNGIVMKPICKIIPCKNKDEVWWPESEQCEKITNIIKECKGKHVITNSYGEGECGCNSLYGEFENYTGCYEYYQRGPCSEDEVVTRDLKTGYAVCTKDSCLDKNILNKKDNRKYFAPVLGKGKCGRLGDEEICHFIGDNSVYEIDELEHIPTCSNRTKEWYKYDFPLMIPYSNGGTYDCSNWFNEVLNGVKCECFTGIHCPFFNANTASIGSIITCKAADSNCRPIISPKTERSILFLNDLETKSKRRRKPTQ